MTAASIDRPQRPALLTVAEYTALGETEPGYAELFEGRLQMSPSPAPDHTYAEGEVRDVIKAGLPPGFEVHQDVDLDLQLADADKPGFVRRPDVVVIRAEARRRIRAEDGLLRACEALLVVEIVSPSSVRTDRWSSGASMPMRASCTTGSSTFPSR